MKQYCRYCMNAIDYNGEATDCVCMAEAPCGADGSGEFYDAAKAKRPNKCKHYVHCGLDIFSYAPDGSFREYKPREYQKPRRKAMPKMEQLDMFEGDDT